MFYRFLPHILKCYSKKKPFFNKEKIVADVVVSFTTTPARIHKIQPLINSILLQSHLPSKIYLWIPKQYKRFNNTNIIEIPAFLKNHSLINIELIEKDWGPASKLLPCLEKFQDHLDLKIIVVDDDRVYDPNLIASLVAFSNNNPDKAISNFGLTCKDTFYPINKKPIFIDTLCGFNAYLVKPKFFSDAIFHYPEHLPEAFFEDDVWISGHLEWNHIKKIRLPFTCWDFLKNRYDLNQNISLRNEQSSSTCLKNENKGGNNFKKTWHYFLQAKKEIQT